jgi:predicted Rossmann fold nucleotide-binding protein DprA/Smf involved in DNA uptake
MVVAETSRNSYQTVLENGTVRTQADVIYYAFLSNQHSTLREIAQHTGIPPYVVSARLADLRHSGRIIEIGQRKCRVSGVEAKTWRAIENPRVRHDL